MPYWAAWLWLIVQRIAAFWPMSVRALDDRRKRDDHGITIETLLDDECLETATIASMDPLTSRCRKVSRPAKVWTRSTALSSTLALNFMQAGYIQIKKDTSVAFYM